MNEIITNYKNHIQNYGLSDELFKWELLAKYASKPSIEMDKFVDDFKAIDFKNLLYHNAIAVRNHLLKDKPEEYRKCFVILFDESISLHERIKKFENGVLNIYRTLVSTLGHHHDERTIATFLTFYNPQKYTLYKDSFYKKYCHYLGINHKKKGEKYVHYLELVNKFINEYIKPDNELIALFRSKLPKAAFQDPNYLILAQDILYLTFDRNIGRERDTPKRYWIYAPGENAELWDEFYENRIMALGWDSLGDLNDYENRELIQRELQRIENTKSTKRNDTAANIDFKEKMQVGDVVFVKKGRSELLGYGIVRSDCYFEDERVSFKNCRDVEWQKKGNWKTDHSLVLKTLTDITDYSTENPNFKYYYETLFALMEDNKTGNKRFSLNQILFGPPGTGKTYNSINKAISIANPDFDLTQDRKTIKEEFDRLLEIGQIVFTTFHQSMSYEDFIEGIKPIKPLLTDTFVKYDIEDGIFKRIAKIAQSNKNNAQFSNKNKLSFEQAFELLKDEWEYNPEMKFPMKTQGYDYTIIGFTNSAIQFKKASGGTRDSLNINTLRNIYYGEDYNFKQGVGIYYPAMLNKLNSFTNTANEVNERSFVIVIDEINRGNVSQIFGELITLLEEDKRAGKDEALKVMLPYSKEIFSVPSNLYIIGTMNTADRSVEALDTALRRRFSFEEMPPKYDLEKFDDEIIQGITRSNLLKTINLRLEKLLDKDHLIGHSFFICQEAENLIEKIKDAFYKNIIPLLQEYFYGDYGKIGLVLGSGFVRKKESSEQSVFANFENYDFSDRIIYEIIDYRKEENSAFENALKTLMNKKSETAK